VVKVHPLNEITTGEDQDRRRNGWVRRSVMRGVSNFLGAYDGPIVEAARRKAVKESNG